MDFLEDLQDMDFYKRRTLTLNAAFFIKKKFNFKEVSKI